MKGEPGEIINGRFRLLKRIGEGDFGVVFEALDVQTGEHVALKSSDPSLCKSETAKTFRSALAQQIKDLYQSEGMLQWKISAHPNVNRVRWRGDHEGWPYIVSDLQPGSLADRLREKRRLKPGEATGIAKQVCRALEAAHEAGVFHLDLCPENVLIAKDKSVKLADFGIGKSFDLLPPSGTGFPRGQGRPEYMPPERLQEEPPPFGKDAYRLMDIYALGVTLFKMLSGKPPFPGDRRGVIEQQGEARLEDRLPSIRQHVPEVPEELDRIVQTAIALEPGQRFQMARDFREALEKVSRTEPATGGRASQAQPPLGVIPPHAPEESGRGGVTIVISIFSFMKEMNVNTVKLAQSLRFRHRDPSANGSRGPSLPQVTPATLRREWLASWPIPLVTLAASIISLVAALLSIEASTYAAASNILGSISMPLLLGAAIGEGIRLISIKTYVNGGLVSGAWLLLFSWTYAFGRGEWTLPSHQMLTLWASVGLLSLAAPSLLASLLGGRRRR